MEFRVKDNDSGKYLEKEDCLIEIDGNVLDCHGDTITESVTIERFTGLLDRNGKKIFEGDTGYLFNDSQGETQTVLYDNSRAIFILSRAWVVGQKELDLYMFNDHFTVKEVNSDTKI